MSMDNAVMDILRLLEPKPTSTGLKVVKVLTAEPGDVTVAFEGTSLALDLDIFEIPVSLYPLLVDDRFLALPILGDGYSQRWGLLGKLTGGVVMGTMKSASTMQLDGSEMTYAADRLIIPQYVAVAASTSNGYLTGGDIRALQSGDRVSVLPTLDGDVVKYVITARY